MSRDQHIEQVVELNEEDEAILRRYLLGELSAPERQQVEERMLVDEGYFQHLLLVEDDLADEYVRESLSPDQADRVRRRLLSIPERRGDLLLARTLQKHISEHQGDSSKKREPASQSGSAPPIGLRNRIFGFAGLHPGLTWALAAALILLIGLGVWQGFEVRRLQRQLEEVRAQKQAQQEREEDAQRRLAEQAARNEQLLQQADRRSAEAQAQLAKELDRAQRENTQTRTAKPQISQPAQVLPPFVLIPGLTRDETGANRIILPATRTTVTLKLALEEARYSSYRVTLQNDLDQTIKTWDRLKATRTGSGIFVVVNLPSTSIPAGEYRLRLSGINGNQPDDIASYYLRVGKR